MAGKGNRSNWFCNRIQRFTRPGLGDFPDAVNVLLPSRIRRIQSRSAADLSQPG